jgi:hypothetical protein
MSRPMLHNAAEPSGDTNERYFGKPLGLRLACLRIGKFPSVLHLDLLAVKEKDQNETHNHFNHP